MRVPMCVRAYSATVVAILILFGIGLAEDRKKPEEMDLEDVISEARGQWVGRGSSSEVRFRHKMNLLILTVKHETEFFFQVDESGVIEGEGTIIYSLERNTTGLDDLAAQVRGAIGMLPTAIPSMPATEGESVNGHGMDLMKQGVGDLMKVQYDAPHLKYGRELRRFRFTGRIREDGLRKVIQLDVVNNFTRQDGEPNSTLIAEWEVNGKREEKPFPCWSPFLENPGILRRGPGGIWIADFLEEGTNRQNKRIWQEYAYVWMVRRVAFTACTFRPTMP